ncbi:proline dehydrogenase family protein [Polaromonas sp.]|uniref:proline dehydrogenase family protein n=1 Tax=Polaromonas sp. TaxID=1869339 RepID=UPI00286B8215|nr:proline dehydrogenase family protein [Polaromonas sp.]
MQAYQTRALALIEHVIVIGRKYRLRLMCRLVKGACWDSKIKRAQELLAAPDAIYPQFAGHNAGTIAAIMQMASRTGGGFEPQRLHGMGGPR